MKNYLRILAYSRPYRHYVPVYLLLTLFSVIFGTVNFALLIPVLNILFGTVQSSVVLPPTPPSFSLNPIYFKELFDYYLVKIVQEYENFTALQFVCVVIVVSVLLSNACRYVSFMVMNKTMHRLVTNMRADVFDKLISLDLGYLSNEVKGDLMSRISNDVQQVENQVVSSLKTIIKEPLTILANFGVLLYISFKLTIFVFLVLPVAVLFISRISKSLRKYGKDSQSILGAILSTIDETLAGLKIIRAFNATNFVREKFSKQNHEYLQVTVALHNKVDLSSPISEVIGVVVVTFILLYGGNLVWSNTGELTAASFITYIGLFLQVLNPAKAVSSMVGNVQRGLAASERIWEVLDIEPKIQDSPQNVKMKDFKQTVSFRNVSFGYHPDRLVLKNISLTIERGTTVALVGNSGGGKSTLADLLPRFHDVWSGEILIDGINVKNIELESLRGLFGIVTQESILFNDTIFNNIAFGNPHATLAQVEQAARIANAHDFIMETENGYYTNIGDRGAKLSGGQRQRISIARAVLKNPPILILDEATSALDSESERLVQQALNKVMQNRTSVVIAHRLSTIQNADLIVVIQDGEIVQQGTHQTLLQNEGLYRKLNLAH